MTNPRYVLELECTPRPGLDPDKRLARALKSLLRAHGFRCRHVALIPEPADQPPMADQAPMAAKEPR